MIPRLGINKVKFLARGVAGVRPHSRVLELFGGTGLSSLAIASCIKTRLISIDLAVQQPCTKSVQPLCADVRALPLADEQFDFVIAPDSPRTRFNGTGVVWGLSVEEQRDLFVSAFHSAMRVLRYGGVFAATAPVSWIELIGAVQIAAPSRALDFKDCNDPIGYCRKVKE